MDPDALGDALATGLGGDIVNAVHQVAVVLSAGSDRPQ
jgi:hypothetical protein